MTMQIKLRVGNPRSNFDSIASAYGRLTDDRQVIDCRMSPAGIYEPERMNTAIPTTPGWYINVMA